jgi:fluoroquinolone transport system ATP-binding protein
MTMLDVRNLAYTYAGRDQRAVNDISFRIREGEVFGFLGPSGAGKSTTQRILIGLLSGYQGEVEVIGKDLKRWGADYYEQIGVSFELPNHYQKLSALENLEFFRSLYRGATEDPRHLLELVGLSGDTHTRVAQFSKGMQMRLNVARALLNRPPLLFLDEPTSGMDPVNARRIKDLIRHQQQEGRTVFLTTHNMTVADELCDRVAFIVDGQIAAIEAPRELKIQQGTRQVQIEYHVNGHREQTSFALDGLGENRDFLALLNRERIETIHTQEASLEDVFIQVTGRSLT